MRPLDGVRLAFAQIRAQKLKSFFGIVGVLIGAMFLIAVVSLIEGLNRYVEEDFAQQVYGLNTVMLRRLPSIVVENLTEEQRRALRRRPRLTLADASAAQEALGDRALVASRNEVHGSITGPDGTEVENVILTSASAEYFRVRRYDVALGRLFTPPEDRRGAPVIVLGAETARVAFGARDPIGRTVRVGGFPFRVIGVLEEQGSLFGQSLDNLAIAPSRSELTDLIGLGKTVEDIIVRVPSPDVMQSIAWRLEALMRTRHGLRPSEPNDFEVETADESMAFWADISRILFIAFPGLVAVSLVVGALVIMNIMLVSVVERTSEIGLRKALGARRRDVVLQVLIESGTLSGLGAIFGVILGVLLAFGVRDVSPLPAAIAPGWLTAAALLGVGVGVLAGVYPAARAARMDPVVALRQE